MISKWRLLVLHVFFIFSTLSFCYFCITMACSFDETSLDFQDVPVTIVNYVKKVAKREISQHYSPMRIHLHFGPSESDIATYEAIKYVLRMAVSTVSQLIHVIPVTGPLLLDRYGCAKKWNQGVNKGMCSELQRKYKGEFCENKIDLYKIPSQHLSGLAVYDASNSAPVFSLPPGQGVINADFIMYVISHVSDFCLQQDVQAYASYCRLDQNGRPVAGFINFCPNHIQGKPPNKKRMFYVSVHEVFHALGFSKDLFYKYRNCNLESADCTSYKNAIIEDSHGLYRLNLPTVVEQMKKHFMCSENDFGAPLELKGAADSYSSHWDPLLMFGSIMTPSIAEPEFVSIDPITLSVFADTGWYKVNLTAADAFYWGKGKGCNFGLEEHCGKTNYPQLCSLNQNRTSGCDFMQYTIGQCEAVKPNSTCGLYKPNAKEHCEFKKPDKASRTSSKHMRCFLTKEKDMVQPICTAFKCIHDELQVWLNGTWHICPGETEFHLGGIDLLCPQKNLLCQSLHERQAYFRAQDHKFFLSDHNSPEHVISLKIKFDEPTPRNLLEVSSLENFKVAAIEAIAKELSVPLEWIVDTLLTAIKNLVLIIFIDPPIKTRPDDILKLVRSVQKFLNEKSFAFVFFEQGNVIPAVSLDIEVYPELELRTYDTTGYNLFAMTLSLSIFFVLAGALSVLIKCIIQRLHRPQTMSLLKPISVPEVPRNQNGELSGVTVDL